MMAEKAAFPRIAMTASFIGMSYDIRRIGAMAVQKVLDDVRETLDSIFIQFDEAFGVSVLILMLSIEVEHSDCSS